MISVARAQSLVASSRDPARKTPEESAFGSNRSNHDPGLLVLDTLPTVFVLQT
jgi:hypothetical protein